MIQKKGVHIMKKEKNQIKNAKGFRAMAQEKSTWVAALKKPGRPVSDNPKVSVTLRLDADILEHFKSQGDGYQTRINNSLREFIET
jgi:uncharacterized protein (DUF4415 family)